MDVEMWWRWMGDIYACTGWSGRFLTHQPPPISKGKHFQNYKIFPEKLKMVPMWKIFKHMLFTIVLNGYHIVGRMHFQSQQKADNFCKYFAYKVFGPGNYSAWNNSRWENNFWIRFRVGITWEQNYPTQQSINLNSTNLCIYMNYMLTIPKEESYA